MVAYSFQKRFIGHIAAGLDPGPWLPGMKRHTLRHPRQGRAGHAKPGDALQLYTAMRTKHCRLLARVTCLASIPVAAGFEGSEFFVCHRPGEALWHHWAATLQPEPIAALLALRAWHKLSADGADTFARADGFAGLDDMADFFAAGREEPGSRDDGYLDLVLIAWAPL